MQNLKIVFAGTPRFALPALQALVNASGLTVCAVFTQPDRPAHRGQKITPSPVKDFAEKLGIPVHQPERITREEIETLRQYKADFLVVVAYGLLLPAEMLALPQYGCVNLHTSLLPKYRGASPIQAAILSGDTRTGVSFMQMEKDLDAGGVFASFTVEIGAKNTDELARELALVGAQHFPAVLCQIAEGVIRPRAQLEAEVTFTHKIQKQSGAVSFTRESAEEILRKLRAYTPWPGIFTTYKNKNLKILAARIAPVAATVKPGVVMQLAGDVGVQTRAGVLILEKIQLAGKQPLGIAEFMRGEADFLDSHLN